MIIHQPEIISENGRTTLAARIELKAAADHFPEYIWYMVPEKFGSGFSLQADPFLAAAVLAGMYFEEDIEVRGPVSPKLAYQIHEYIYLMNNRMPNEVKKIKVHMPNTAPLKNKPTAVGTTFTGGVDSLFTIQQHLAENQAIEEYQVTHGVFLHGFDILPHEDHNYQRLCEMFAQQAQEINVELLPLQTNMVSLLHQRLNLPYFYGPLIVSSGLALSGLFGKFYVPSSWTHETIERTPHTSDSLADSLLSTDTMEIIHHGSAVDRIEKVEALSEWAPGQKMLWVCSEAGFSEHHINCGWCEKCVRTMIPLYALGQMEKFTTFRRPLQKDSDILRYWRKFTLRSNYVSEMFAFLRKHKPSALPWLMLAAFIGYFRYLAIKYLPGFAKRFLRRFGKFIDRNEAPDAYEVREVTEMLRKERG